MRAIAKIEPDVELRRELDRRLGALRIERASFIDHWRDLSDHILPRGARFFVTDRNRGERKNMRIMDNTATMSVRTMSSGMMSGLTSPARPWFSLKTSDPGLNEYKPIKMWLELVRDRMAEVFLRSNLYTTLPITYTDLGVFGTHAFAVLEDDQSVIRCFPFPIGSYCIGTNHRGVVDTCYREFQMSRKQLVEQFGIENVSPQVRQAYDLRQGVDAWVDVVHAVEPNPDHDERKPHAKYKPFRSVYYEKGGVAGQFLKISGFDTFPIMVARWSITGEDIYGTSPAMDALGDIRALQLEQKRKAQAIDKLVNPPMKAPSALRNQRASLLPGDVTYVDSSQGGQSFEPAYIIKPELQALMEDIQENQARIRKAFFEDIFLMIANDQRSGVTATEIQERHEEKMLMLGPILERMNDELLDPLIERTFSIMVKMNIIPPPPPEVQGMNMAIEYVSILAQAQKMIGVGAIEKYVAFVGNLATARPEVLDLPDWDQTVDTYGDMIGIPPQLQRDPQLVALDRQQRAKQQQAQQAMQMAQAGAQTAQTLGQTPVTSDSALGAMISRATGGVAQ